MKKTILLALTLLPAFALAQKFNYTVTGKFSGSLPNTKLYLTYDSAGVMTLFDSTKVSAGRFMFSGSRLAPLKIQLVLDHQNLGLASIGKNGVIDNTTIYLEPGNIDVSAKDSIKNAIIKGHELNADNEELKKWLAISEKNTAIIMAHYQSVRAVIGFNDSLFKATDKLLNQEEENKNAIMLKFTKKHHHSYVGLVTLEEVAGISFDINVIEPLFKQFSAATRKLPAGVELARNIAVMRSTKIGSYAPPFTINDADGHPVSLKDFRGRYVLVDFWASWCGPCRSENPNVVKAYNQYRNKNFTVLGVSLDGPDEKNAWLTAIKTDRLDWPQVSELKFWKSNIVKQYGIVSIPQNLLIDPSGKIIAKNLRGEDLINKLGGLLK